MKKYIDNITNYMEINFPDSGCDCYKQFVLDEEFLCDLCLSRLKRHRRKLKHEIRLNSKKKHDKYQ